MKRHEGLRGLSDDHHRALVLARELRRAGSAEPGERPEQLAARIRAQFEAELEPHFRVEEDVLLPALSRRGETELVERTLQDHERLRSWVRGEWSGSTAQEIGALLERHVRFEERELFPSAEARLTESELRSVEEARRVAS